METIRRCLKQIIPAPLFRALQPYYHYLLAYASAVRYRYPARELTVIGVTGTKGKSSTVEIIAHLLRAEGHTVASLSTIQFSVGDATERNLFKMTMPGRSFVQHFLRRAVGAGCQYAVVEMTSEGAKQFRHKFIDLDALVFTNLTPEHIESHGSFANYKAAKLSIASGLANSQKRPRYLVANRDDEHGQDFLTAATVEHALGYSLDDLELYSLHKDSSSLVIDGVTIRVPLIGKFNVYNVLAALTLTRALGVSLTTAQRALSTLPPLRGRVEIFTPPAGSPKQLSVVVDYAHTPDSLTQLYEAFPQQHKVCVLGNTGGGRDTWKRPEMAAIAERYCQDIVFTNEDPYDEDPRKIVAEMERGLSERAPVTVIMDRRAAIRHAIEIAPPGSVVLVSGKGTDPYIMGPNGSKEPWSDATVVQEELERLANGAGS